MNDALLPVLTTSNVKALSLALLLFIYVIIALSASKIHYTETIHRITVEKIFDQNLFGSKTADALAAVGLALLFATLILPSRSYIWALSAAAFAGGIAAFVIESEVLVIAALATVPALAALAVVKHSAVSKNPGGRSKLSSIAFPEASRVGLAILLVIAAIEAAALGRWITYPAFPTEMYGDASWKFAGLESALFNTLGLLSPILVVLIAFSFLYWWYIVDI
ncbi:MAG: hypothetical protein MN733_37855, partial [Nitrososphaera sp.]|nr:hypothetical protein [Nitrososphaera sp.]